MGLAASVSTDMHRVSIWLRLQPTRELNRELMVSSVHRHHSKTSVPVRWCQYRGSGGDICSPSPDSMMISRAAVGRAIPSGTGNLAASLHASCKQWAEACFRSLGRHWASTGEHGQTSFAALPLRLVCRYPSFRFTRGSHAYCCS